MTLHAAIQNVRLYLRDMERAGLYSDDQVVASGPLVPPDGGSPATITIGDLRDVLERHSNDRWNVHEDGADVLICRGLHDRAAPCEYERFVPADRANSEIGESDNAAAPAAAAPSQDSGSKIIAGLKDVLAYVKGDKSKATLLTVMGGKVVTLAEADGAIPLIPQDDAKRADYFEDRMRHWLGEAQRLAALVTALGGNPEPDAPQPLEAPGEERYRNKEEQAPADVVDHLRHRLEGIIALWAANGQPDHGQIAFLLRVAKSYVNLPVLSAAAWERAEICKVLGIVDKPGVPLRHVQEILARKEKAYQREVELLRSWDKANPTERQELDRMRRGWGPSSPTERMRRKSDVLGCLQAITSAMSELAVPEEDMEALGDEANAYIEAAHDRLDKWHTVALAIVRGMNDDPQEWPDIRAAEERGAMAMRRVLKALVSGLLIDPVLHPESTIENSAFDSVLRQIEYAPLPHDYHGSARDDVRKILANAKPAP